MIREWILRWLEIDKLGLRMKDVERHFVTKRDAAGMPTETLADVPLEERKNRFQKPRGMTVSQLKNWAEVTDGGRLVNRG